MRGACIYKASGSSQNSILRSRPGSKPEASPLQGKWAEKAGRSLEWNNERGRHVQDKLPIRGGRTDELENGHEERGTDMIILKDIPEESDLLTSSSCVSAGSSQLQFRCFDDDRTIQVEERVAFMSPVLKNLVENNCGDALGNGKLAIGVNQRTFCVSFVTYDILRKVFEYCIHSAQNPQKIKAPNKCMFCKRSDRCKSVRTCPRCPSRLGVRITDSWEQDFVKQYRVSLLQLLDASYYLQLEELKVFLKNAIGEVIAPMSRKELQLFMGLHNEPSEEEYRLIREAFPLISIQYLPEVIRKQEKKEVQFQFHGNMKLKLKIKNSR